MTEQAETRIIETERIKILIIDDECEIVINPVIVQIEFAPIFRESRILAISIADDFDY